MRTTYQPIHFSLRSFCRLICGLLCYFLVRFISNCRVVRHPDSRIEPCIFACNHRSFLDPIACAIFVRRSVSFFARANLWKYPIIGQALRVFGGVPVDRSKPSLSSMKQVIDCLRSGYSILVFPEGTRTKTGRLGRMREGPALFARRAGVPVVPVYLHRGELVWPRWSPLPLLSSASLRLYYGPALSAPKHLPPREQDRWLSQAIDNWMLRQEAILYREPIRESSDARQR